MSTSGEGNTLAMTIVSRVLPADPVRDLEDYVRRGGGAGLELAERLRPDELIRLVDESGLRGRGGAGFPTGLKWRTVAAQFSPTLPTAVVANGAEGEPGTFKDRAILRADPYQMLEGALIAARAVAAADVVIALKAAMSRELDRVGAAVAEAEKAGWLDGVEVSVFEGPDEYLYGEETALLEAVHGRPPFPRIAPPWRRGLIEVVATDADATSESGQAAAVELAGSTEAPPALVNNVETLANVPAIVARGPDWFRGVGTPDSPGTIVCTVTGSTRRAGVGEVPIGTPLRTVIEQIGGGVPEDRTVQAVLAGVANPILTAEQLDTPLSHEGMDAIGAGLGSAGFIVFDDTVDLATVAAGVARFLAVESCGQCLPCKRDGLRIADAIAHVCRGETDAAHADAVVERLATVADGARCALASQQQQVIGSLLARFPDLLRRPRAEPAAPMLIAELLDIDGDTAIVNERFASKQPDWTYDAVDSGRSPAERLADARAEEPVDG
jgi:NADH-quinone oxidoreductase subunit F